VRYAVHLHARGPLADPRRLVDLAVAAEDAGWDGVFVNDHLAAAGETGPQPVANPWIALAAMATATRRVRLGPMVAALPRRRPWQVAGEAATLDHLSAGRLILGAGSGTGLEHSFAPFGEALDAPRRAALLDEGLEVLTRLWTGTPATYAGSHYRLEGATALPRPVQTPRIPIWVAATWPHRRPFRRAARWDGVFVDTAGLDWLQGEIVPLEALTAALRYTLARRPAATPFDVVIGGRSPADGARAAARLAPYAAAGLSWWVEGIDPSFGPPPDLLALVRRGPPRR
jgi:alkanesulfonate monooxygenase SsuD/methylene tetrahydromethanopterin reductase-like flavin-dependent oxidoreductase (luciferase family)